MSSARRYLVLSEVAERARAPLSTVRYWIGTGRLESVRPGRRRLVAEDTLARFLEGEAAPRGRR